METDNHNKDFALRLVLKERLKAIWQWPVVMGHRIAESVIIFLRQEGIEELLLFSYFFCREVAYNIIYFT